MMITALLAASSLLAVSVPQNLPALVSQGPVATTEPGDEASAAETPAPDFPEFHRVMGWNLTRGLFSWDNLLPAAIGTLGAVMVKPIDGRVSDGFVGSAHELGDTGHVIGHPLTALVSTSALLLATPFTDNQKFRSFAFTLAQAHILDSALKYPLKAAIPRTRPNGEGNNSLPSGHTSSTFAFATVAGHYYGKKVSIPAYAAGILVAASRIENGTHFLSDVVLGAALGYIAGRTAIRGTDHSVSEPSLSIRPAISAGRASVSVDFRF